MPVSFDSESPILANEKNNSSSSSSSSKNPSRRISTYSKTPSTPSDCSQQTMATGDDFKRYTTSLDRMADKRLQDQRYSITEQQESEMSKLALAGKVQKALERRYQNQDAVMKPKKASEKT